VDYPDYGYKLAEAIASGVARGVAICGSGSASRSRSTATRRRGRRSFGAAVRPLAREHNDANVIAMGARLIGSRWRKPASISFLTTGYGGERHQRRVEKLSNPSFAKESA
jgi:ribose 5-phosphate isomerase B